MAHPAGGRQGRVAPGRALYARRVYRHQSRARCRPGRGVFYNQRGTAEQYIKEGKNAVKWTRLSCRTMRGNAVRLQLHALAYILANFLRTFALPQEVQHWSLTSIRDRLVTIGAKLAAMPAAPSSGWRRSRCPETCSAVSMPTSLICDVERPPHADSKV
jgi:hypothetical protein